MYGAKPQISHTHDIQELTESWKDLACTKSSSHCNASATVDTLAPPPFIGCDYFLITVFHRTLINLVCNGIKRDLNLTVEHFFKLTAFCFLVRFASCPQCPCFCSWCPLTPPWPSFTLLSTKTLIQATRCSVHAALRGRTCCLHAPVPMTPCVCRVLRNTSQSSGTSCPNVCTAPTSAREIEWWKSSARPRTIECASVKKDTTGRTTSASRTHSVLLDWASR